MNKPVRNVIRLTAFLLLAAGMLLLLNQIFLYKDGDEWSTDRRVEVYQSLPEDSLDVLFLGSSHLMSGVNPLQLWEETGIQSYVLASRAQTFPFSYEYLKDALKTQKPDIVVLDAFSVLTYKDALGLISGEFHLSVNMDNLSDESRYELVKEYVPKEERLYYLFPLLKNHNYFKTWEDGLINKRDEIFFGYCYVDYAESFEKPVYTDLQAPMSEIDERYFRQMIELCREQNIAMCVIKTPVVVPDQDHAVLNTVKEVCAQNGVWFYDMSSDTEAWGFDFATGMMSYDHTNTTGAEIVTARLATLLPTMRDFSFSERHRYANLWQAEAERMHLKRAEMTGIILE